MQCGQDQVTVLGVEQPVQPDHAGDGAGGVQIAFVPFLLGLRVGAGSVDGVLPVLDHPAGVRHRQTLQRCHQHPFVSDQILGDPFPGVDDHPDLIEGDPSTLKRLEGGRQPGDGMGDRHQLVGPSSEHATPVLEEGGDRGVTF